jgi:hypothetical protein
MDLVSVCLQTYQSVDTPPCAALMCRTRTVRPLIGSSWEHNEVHFYYSFSLSYVFNSSVVSTI